MQPWQIIAALAVILVVGGALAWFFARRRRSQQLSEHFGPEYHRAVEQRGDQGAAEEELATRQKRVAEMEIRPLGAEQQERYARDWRAVQASFVDDPTGAIAEADRLVTEVMGERGYPMADFEQRAADVSVNHPTVVADYRAAHAIAGRQASGDEVSTEELRQAMVHYRSLFNDLLETQQVREAAHA